MSRNQTPVIYTPGSILAVDQIIEYVRNDPSLSKVTALEMTPLEITRPWHLYMWDGKLQKHSRYDEEKATFGVVT